MLISTQENIYYAIGFSTAARRPAQIGLNAVLMSREGAWFVFPEAWAPLVAGQVDGEEVSLVPYTKEDKGPAEAIARLLWDLGEGYHRDCVELGFERGGLELSLYLDLEECLGKRGKAVAWQDVTPLFCQARLVKSEEEVLALKQSAAVAREAMEYAKTILHPGKTELDLVAELEYFMRRKGSEGVPFTMKALAGENAARTINLPGRRRIRRGDVVLLDFGAVAGHYASDWTRSFAVGEASPRLTELYRLVWQIERECIARVRPGVNLKDLMECAGDMLKGHPLKPFFNPYLGHSIGLNSQEWPSIVPGADMELQENMVITIEPGIYVPGLGGVRIEDEVWVTADGHEILTGLSEEGFVAGEGLSKGP